MSRPEPATPPAPLKPPAPQKPGGLGELRAPVTARAVARGLRAAGVAVREVTVLSDRHADRPVFAGRLAGAPVVVKYHGAAAGEAFVALQRIWAGPLGPLGRSGAVGEPGVPRPVALAPAAGLVVMEHLEGPLGSVRGVPADDALGPAAALLLARLHGTAAQGWRPRSARGVVRSLLRKVADLERTDPPLAARVAGVVDRLAGRLPVETEPVVTHGDFSPRNLVITPDGPRLIDVDRMRLASPARDVAYWAAWDFATRVLAGLEPTWHPGGVFTAAYLRARPEGAAELARSLTFHQAAALVRIVHGWSALQGHPAAARIVAEAERLAA